MTAVFAFTLFVSSCLLFLVEPMFAKMILPRFGGAPAVWNTCLVFFQVALLAGYSYAHFSLTGLRRNKQILSHLAVLALPLLVLPVRIASTWRPPAVANPAVSVLALMLVTVGLPFFALSTSASVIQRWYSFTGHKHARDPYFLYVASNTGSIVGLIGYVVFFEPVFALSQQRYVWAGGYMAFLTLMALCALLTIRSTPPKAAQEPLEEHPHDAAQAREPMTAVRRLRWIGLAFIPSSLTLGLTTSITANIAAIPLLWVVPLTLYLLTFMIAFSRRTFVPHKYVLGILPVLLLAQLLFLGIGPESMPWGALVIQMLTFFAVALACHKELANDRPSVSRLTEFYLLLSVGGALGGAFNALLAPILFKSAIEYPLVSVFSAILLTWPFRSAASKIQMLTRKSVLAALDVVLPLCLGLGVVIAMRSAVQNSAPQDMSGSIVRAKLIACVICLLFVRRHWRFALGLAAILLAIHIAQPRPGLYVGEPKPAIYQARSFFGIHRVEPDPSEMFHQLFHGAIVHGIQCIVGGQDQDALTYYYRTGPAGELFTEYVDDAKGKTVALIGMGAGSLAAYAREGQTFTFYEIDPVVTHIASNPEYFTYLRDARERNAKIDIKLGDGRLEIATAPDASYDVIVVDAFSGDSVPAHLLTREAMELYVRKLKPHGIIAMHITNAYMDLEPVVANAGVSAGLACLYCPDIVLQGAEEMLGKKRSQWMMAARKRSDLAGMAADQRWRFVGSDSGARVWTDDYSNILGAIRWDKFLSQGITPQ